jgi:hypothetical protein
LIRSIHDVHKNIRPLIITPGLAVAFQKSGDMKGSKIMARKNGKKITYHRRILNLLADGKPHTFEEIFKGVARFIPAETADKEYQKRHPNWKQEKVAVRVAQGRKRLVFLSLNSAIHHAKTIVATGRDWTRKYRLTKAALKARQEREPQRDGAKA